MNEESRNWKKTLGAIADSFGQPLVAVLISLLLGAVVIMICGENVFTAYGAMIRGAFGNEFYLNDTLKRATPIIMGGLAVCIAWRSGYEAMGGEGQMILGAFCSALVAYYLPLPGFVRLLLAMLAAVVVGAAYSALSAWLYDKFEVTFIISTLMLNYIALYLVSWLQEGPWRDPGANGFPKIASFDKSAVLPKLFGVQIGWVIALVLVAILFVYLRYTKQGYEISVVGESRATANYAGMNVQKIILRTMFLSGAVAGIAGMVQATGSDITLSTGVAGGVGFTGIIIAWLAQLNPYVSLLISAAFSILVKGSSVVQSSYGLSTDCAEVLQGIILFFIMAMEFFIRYKIVFRGHKEKRPALKETPAAPGKEADNA